MMDTMGSAEATQTLGGEQLAGIIGAINPDELAEVMPSEVLMEAAEKMTIENFEAMSGEGAGAMFDVLGAEQVFESLGEVQVAGMFSAMDAEQMATLGTETIAEALTTMGTDNAVAMGADNLAEMMTAMDSESMSVVGGEALTEMAGAMTGEALMRWIPRPLPP